MEESLKDLKKIFNLFGWEYSTENTEGADAIILGEGIKGYVFDVSKLLNHSLKAIPNALCEAHEVIDTLKEKKVDLIILTNHYVNDIIIRGDYKATWEITPRPEDIRWLAKAERKAG